MRQNEEVERLIKIKQKEIDGSKKMGSWLSGLDPARMIFFCCKILKEELTALDVICAMINKNVVVEEMKDDNKLAINISLPLLNQKILD
jgi:hypothetical protein